jgi:hypothetical protein
VPWPAHSFCGAGWTRTSDQRIMSPRSIGDSCLGRATGALDHLIWGALDFVGFRHSERSIPPQTSFGCWIFVGFRVTRQVRSPLNCTQYVQGS